ncbi:MAG: TIGR03936 family radical SAM-associated protein [Bacillota bacterium]
MRWRVEYEKGPAIRYLSHLDMVRLWERMLRRSNLPLQLTQGFNPHFKISLGTVLPVGLWGKREYLDMKLEDDLKPDDLYCRLEEVTPPGIKVHRVKRLSRESPSLMEAVNTSAYRITFPSGLEEQVREGVRRMERAPEIRVTRAKDQREVNIRPGILRISCIPADNESILEFMVVTGNQNAVRFPELVQALVNFGLDRESIIDYWREANYIRVNGKLMDPLELN